MKTSIYQEITLVGHSVFTVHTLTKLENPKVPQRMLAHRAKLKINRCADQTELRHYSVAVCVHNSICPFCLQHTEYFERSVV